MNIPLVDLKAQYEDLKTELEPLLTEVMTRSAFIGGPYVKSFETAFAEFCGVRHCIGVGNGTDALFLALKCLGIGPGDRVVVPANSFIATSEAVTMTGARVFFVDIDPVTFNLDPNQLENLLKSQRTANRPGYPIKAVIPVHLYGQPADMGPILDLARKYEFKVIEDAAQAHGAVYQDRTIGSLGDAACFSFYPGKNLGAYGDGGAVVTDNDALAVKIRMVANHGRIGKYDHEFEGVNSRLDGVQAAILGLKLNRLPEWTDKRRQNAYKYNELLKDSGLSTPLERDGLRSVYHLYVVRVEPGRRQALQDHLQAAGISTGIHYPIALPDLKAYEYLGQRGVHQRATEASREILSLPLFPELREEQIVYISEKMKEFLG
jgi:dTDP-4-amino-4,6-dideoxygalactose transaminase